MVEIIADLHTHSIASTHAYSTIGEMVQSAREKGLFAIAITDHARLMPGSPGPWHFVCLAGTVPLYYKGVLTLAGIEANIFDFDGNIDLDERDAANLDWVVASVHHIGLPGLQDPTVEKCTHMWLKIAENPMVNVIGHSGDPVCAYDYDKVIPVFGEKGKLVEINSHSFEVRPQNVENCRKIALCCKKYGVPILVSSDAHFETEVANFDKALHMLEDIDFPKELIVNASKERLLAYLEKHSMGYRRRTAAAL